MEITPLYDTIHYLITTYFVPVGLADDVDSALIWLSATVAVFIFWFSILRPFYLFIKYGMFGGGKKSRAGSGRKRSFDPDDD